MSIAAQALEAKVNQLEEEHSNIRRELLQARTQLAASESINADLKAQLLALQQVVALYGNGLLTVPWVHLVDLSPHWPSERVLEEGARNFQGYEREPVSLYVDSLTLAIGSASTDDRRDPRPRSTPASIGVGQLIDLRGHRARGSRLLLALVPEVRW